MGRPGKSNGILIIVVVAAMLGGCGGTAQYRLRDGEVPRVWPPPPETPRIQYLGTLETEEDVGRRQTLLEGLGALIFGKKELGVFVAPSDVIMTGQGQLMVADSAGGVIHSLHFGTRRYHQFKRVAGGRELSRPVALIEVDNRILVVDSRLHAVCVFQPDGSTVTTFGERQLKRPSGIAYDPQRREIIVSDTGDHNLKVFDRTGRLVRTIGTRGSGPGQFNFPTCLWMDDQDRLYVSDTLNYRIQVLSPGGQVLMLVGEHGDRPGYFAHPSGVATDSLGHLYVVDRQFENVQVFDTQGRILMAFGREGHGAGEFWLPSGVFVDDHNRIYVADAFNKRIQVFQLLENPGYGE